MNFNFSSKSDNGEAFARGDAAGVSAVGDSVLEPLRPQFVMAKTTRMIGKIVRGFGIRIKPSG